VLFVDDEGATPVDTSEVKMVTGDAGAEVMVAGWKITFPYRSEETARIVKVP